MSSNPNHITPVLTRTNYEEYFLLYVDNELTPEGKKAVDAFVLLHPDLKEELETLSSAILPAEAVSFDNKSVLLADSMKVNTVDESLLLYIDGELPAWEAQIVEAQLKQDAAFALQHQQLLKTKLAPEQLTYPYKRDLYRNTKRRIAPVWLRVAAAVVIIAGAGTTAWLTMNTSNNTGADVAVVMPKNEVQKTTPEPKLVEIHIPTVPATAVANTKKNVQKLKSGGAKNTVAAAKRPAKKKDRATFSKPHTAIENTVASNNLPTVKKAETPDLKSVVAQKKYGPAINNSPVTSEVPSTYISIDAAAKTTVPVAAVATTTDSERGGGSVKGFLRKATRFIERRTGIKAVNDDDELLVGAVALKLK